jgi:hypothetical protein
MKHTKFHIHWLILFFFLQFWFDSCSCLERSKTLLQRFLFKSDKRFTCIDKVKYCIFHPLLVTLRAKSSGFRMFPIGLSGPSISLPSFNLLPHLQMGYVFLKRKCVNFLTYDSKMSTRPMGEVCSEHWTPTSKRPLLCTCTNHSKAKSRAAQHTGAKRTDHSATHKQLYVVK